MASFQLTPDEFSAFYGEFYGTLLHRERKRFRANALWGARLWLYRVAFVVLVAGTGTGCVLTRQWAALAMIGLLVGASVALPRIRRAWRQIYRDRRISSEPVDVDLGPREVVIRSGGAALRLAAEDFVSVIEGREVWSLGHGMGVNVMLPKRALSDEEHARLHAYVDTLQERRRIGRKRRA